MLERFRENYGALFDAVIKEVHLVYPGYTQNGDEIRVTLIIDCKNVAKGFTWETVKMIFYKTVSFQLYEDKSTHQVISEAVYKNLDNVLAFDFAGNTEWSSIDDLRKSSFYIVAQEFSFEVVNA